MMEVSHQKTPVQSSNNPQHHMATHTKHGATTAATAKQNGQPELMSGDSQQMIDAKEESQQQ